jgi:adenylyl-sulfate kinase
MIIWLTGLPCSGKTTLGRLVVDWLLSAGYRAELLDGDALRQTLSSDLGFSHADREENVKRIGAMATILSARGSVAVVSAVSPYRSTRDLLRDTCPGFIEVYVNAPLSVCERRDVKGMYKQARAGERPGFTGIDDPYEPPFNPEVECKTDTESIGESVKKIVRAVSTLRHLLHSAEKGKGKGKREEARA